jgi:hypothetical protein
VQAVQWLGNELEDREILVRFRGKWKDKNVQTGYVDHPALHSVAAGNEGAGTLN